MLKPLSPPSSKLGSGSVSECSLNSAGGANVGLFAKLTASIESSQKTENVISSHSHVSMILPPACFLSPRAFDFELIAANQPKKKADNITRSPTGASEGLPGFNPPRMPL